MAERILALRNHDGLECGTDSLCVRRSRPETTNRRRRISRRNRSSTHWPSVTPFALTRANQFRPGPPPALTSERYSDALNEVESVGIAGQHGRDRRRGC